MSKYWTCQMGDLFCSNGWTCMVQVAMLGNLGKLASSAKKNFRKPKLAAFPQKGVAIHGIYDCVHLAMDYM